MPRRTRFRTGIRPILKLLSTTKRITSYKAPCCSTRTFPILVFAWTVRPSKIQDEGYAANLREVEKLPTASPPVRNNPSQIEQDLELRLNEADRQSKQLAATPPSHSVWNSTSIVQGAMLSAAFVGLGLAFLIWKKRG